MWPDTGTRYPRAVNKSLSQSSQNCVGPISIHHESGLQKEAANNGGFLNQPRGNSLLQLGRNAVELAVERAADRIDRRNDHNGDASSDEAVLNRGRTRLVFQKRENL